MKLLEILKRMLSCATTETSEPTEVSKSTVLPLVDSNKESKDYADLDDIRLVVGDKTLALVYNVCMGGLHNVLHYDPCSHDTQDCFSEINAIIEKNLEEAYESIVVKTGENQYLLNIGVNLLLGPGSLSQQLCDDVINVFYPIIKRFIDEHVVNNKVGVYSVFTGGNGTSVGLLGLINLLEKDGYICCGVGTSYDSHSYPLKRAKGWHGFTYIAMEELIKNTEKLPKIKILSLLHDELVAKMGDGTVCLQKVKPEQFIYHNHFEIMEQYGQVRTMADILIGMNEQQHFHSSEEAVAAVEKFIGSQSPCHFAISGKAFHFIADALYSSKAFVDGSLNKDVFLENFTISKFEKNWDNAMYRYYYAKIWKLICYFDEFRRYTSPNQIYRDLKNTISPEYYVMSDSAGSFGSYPRYFFEEAIKEAWNEIAPNNSIDSQLLEKYMFKNHEASVKAIGLEATIEKYFDQDYCWADVYFPKQIGSAPVYIEREIGNKRIFIKSCGEGKGPNNCPEILEFRYAYRLLVEDIKYNIYGSYSYKDFQPELFVPKDDMSLPIYSAKFPVGKLMFENENDKVAFLEKELKNKQLIKKTERKELIKSLRS